jgi:hypothetical protein
MNQPRAPRGVYIVGDGVGGAGPRENPRPAAPPWQSPAPRGNPRAPSLWGPGRPACGPSPCFLFPFSFYLLINSFLIFNYFN